MASVTPPRLPGRAERGVRAALRRLPATCLERAVVLQAWEAAQGRPRDVLIGVTGTEEFRAHAWLEGEEASDTGSSFTVLQRLAPPDRRLGS